MKIDRATLIASAALAVSIASIVLQLIPPNIAPLLGSSPHTWREIARFEGTGNTTTNSFYVPSYLWRINWNITWADLTKDGQLKAYTFSPGIVEKWQNSYYTAGGYISRIYRKDSGSETFSGSGNEFFYFKVETSNVQSWRIWVEAWS